MVPRASDARTSNTLGLCMLTFEYLLIMVCNPSTGNRRTDCAKTIYLSLFSSISRAFAHGIWRCIPGSDTEYITLATKTVPEGN
jgi:hypothetical protein